MYGPRSGDLADLAGGPFEWHFRPALATTTIFATKDNDEAVPLRHDASPAVC